MTDGGKEMPRMEWKDPKVGSELAKVLEQDLPEKVDTGAARSLGDLF